MQWSKKISIAWYGTSVLILSTIFDYPGRAYLLIGLMLFIPLLDRSWKPPKVAHAQLHYLSWGFLVLIGACLLLWQPSYTGFVFTTATTAALPEEWFFRGYFMEALGQGFRANLIASLIFSLLHGFTRDWPTAVMVFLPSLTYGWIYQRTHDLPLVILLHILSNLVFVMFLTVPLEHWLKDI